MLHSRIEKAMRLHAPHSRAGPFERHATTARAYPNYLTANHLQIKVLQAVQRNSQSSELERCSIDLVCPFQPRMDDLDTLLPFALANLSDSHRSTPFPRGEFLRL